MEKSELIVTGINKCCDIASRIQGKTFIVDEKCEYVSAQRNALARAIIVEMNFRPIHNLLVTRKIDKLTDSENDKLIADIDFIINIWESSLATWDLFWEGKQPINPKKMPFIIPGKE